jgi:Polyketide cyclase / dehydrase and lipid transport
MSTTIQFEERVVIPARTISEVFDYVSDFARAADWRVEVVESAMSPPAPMQLGARLREVARIAGREVVTESVVDGLSPPTYWSFAHVSGPLPVSGDYRFEDTPDGVRFSYTLDVDLAGLWMLGAPYLRWSGPRLLRRSLARLAERLTATS